MSRARLLPWERSDGPGTGVGICLSGGGIRAASFSLGVLQALQAERGLLFGERSAQFLAAVSGGSYTAASYILEANRQAAANVAGDELPPLAHDSPEEAHIIASGEYLTPGRWRFLAFTLLNVAALAVLYVWVGLFLSIYALFVRAVADQLWRIPEFANAVAGLPPLLLIGLALLGFYTTIRGIYADGGWRRTVLPVAGLGLYVIAAPGALEWLVKQPDWWSVGHMVLVVGLLLVAVVAVTGATVLARKLGITGAAAAWLNRLTVWAPRLLGWALLAWSAATWYPVIGPILLSGSGGDMRLAVLLSITLLLCLPASYLSDRVSLHHEYRDRLATCFAIRRDGPLAAGRILLSELAPSPAGTRGFPRLLICATANVSAPTQNGGSSSFVPFVFSHDACGVPGYPGASFPTQKLEMVQKPAGLWTRKSEPLVSLMTAVAATGAAISPSMGRQTLPSARMVLAAINVRLGRWMPNPFSMRMRGKVDRLRKPGRIDGSGGLGPGFNELVPEMLGLTGPAVYISDGGHYDNLGLLALLRARCAEIWCVDSSPDPGGRAPELRRVLAEAGAQLGATTEIDLDRFRIDGNGFYRYSHAIGSVSYGHDAVARLIIVKLGLTPATPSDLLARRQTDPGESWKSWCFGRFPHHSTFWQRAFRPDRMDAYRRLGYYAATQCAAEFGASPDVAPADDATR